MTQDEKDFDEIAKAVMQRDPSVSTCMFLITFIGDYAEHKLKSQRAKKGLSYGDSAITIPHPGQQAG